jgi:hypothetical protein
LEDVSGMVVFTKKTYARVLAGFPLLIVLCLLAACGNSGQSSNTKTQPVKQVLTPTATKGTTFKAYKGPDYTINYPQDWKVSSSSTEVAFTDPTGKYNLTIGSTSNPNGNVTADQLAQGGANGAKTNLKNAQSISVPETITIAGQAWSQRALSGTSTYNGQNSDVEAGIVATNHPAKTTTTRGYVIAYVTLKQQFEQAQTLYFTPMLQSFTFI